MFDEDDYPTVDDLEDKISASYEIGMLPLKEHFIVEGLMVEERQKIADAIEQQINDNLQNGVEDIGRRLIVAMNAVVRASHPK